jgi:hypothetical protein
MEEMDEIELEYAEQLGADELAELKQLLERLLAEIDPKGALSPLPPPSGILRDQESQLVDS